MRIRLIAIGKIKEPYLIEGINEYRKRLSSYVNLEIIEVKDESIKENPSSIDIIKAINNEGDRVLKLLKPSDYVISLDLHQKQYKSEEFAEFLNKKMEESGSFLTFIIGGSYGLSDALKKRANSSFSLSEMTFTHQMSRIIVLEQIYRAYKILNHEVYHK